MDRSFLSDARVVTASRNFVCIRLATYEDKAEAEFMKTLFIGRSGQLENTTFAVLSPDGKRTLTATGRGPQHAYRGSQSMADGMETIAAKHAEAKEAALTDTQFGLTGRLLAHVGASASRDELAGKLREVVATFPRKHKDHNSHLRWDVQKTTTFPNCTEAFIGTTSLSATG